MIERSIHGNYANFLLPKNNFCFLIYTSIPLFSQRRKAAKKQRTFVLLLFFFLCCFAAPRLCGNTWGALLSG